MNYIIRGRYEELSCSVWPVDKGSAGEDIAGRHLFDDLKKLWISLETSTYNVSS
jgi:hypothetical protein